MIGAKGPWGIGGPLIQEDAAWRRRRPQGPVADLAPHDFKEVGEGRRLRIHQ
ncbi:MAG: hypothetical protein ACI8PQ_003449, partial [Planctomycetota bacterium]